MCIHVGRLLTVVMKHCKPSDYNLALLISRASVGESYDTADD